MASEPPLNPQKCDNFLAVFSSFPKLMEQAYPNPVIRKHIIQAVSTANV